MIPARLSQCFILRLFFLTSLVWAGSSCSVIPSIDNETVYYLVKDLRIGEVVAEAPKLNGTLLLRETAASRYLNGQRIVFSDSPETRSYYKFAFWLDPPSKMFSQLFQARLEKLNFAPAVVRTTTAAVQGDYQVNTELLEFYHDAASSPEKVRITLSAQLVDLSTRKVIATANFDKSADVPSHNAEGAVQGFSRGVSDLLDDLVRWVAKSIPAA